MNNSGDGAVRKKDDSKIDYLLAFKFIFKDPAWVSKILIGGILVALGVFVVPLFIVEGYFVRIVRHISSGEDFGLPEWDDWGELLKTGFKLTLVRFIYTAPLLFLIPFYALIPLLLSSFIESRQPVYMIFFMFLMLFSQSIFMVMGFAIGFWILAVEIRFARERNIQSCFQFRSLYSFIKNNFKEYVPVFLMILGASYLGGLGMFLLYIGIFFTFFYSYCVKAHLEGQLLRKTTDATGMMGVKESKSLKRKELNRRFFAVAIFVFCLVVFIYAAVLGAFIWHLSGNNGQARSEVQKLVRSANLHIEEARAQRKAADDQLKSKTNIPSKSPKSKTNFHRLQLAHEEYLSNIDDVKEEETAGIEELQKIILNTEASESYKRYVLLKIEALNQERSLDEVKKTYSSNLAEAHRLRAIGDEMSGSYEYYMEQAQKQKQNEYPYYLSHAFEKNSEVLSYLALHIAEFTLAYHRDFLIR